MTITVSTRLITWMLTVAVILLTAAGVAGQFWEHGLGQDPFVEFVRLFDPDAEANVPTWFSSLLLLLAAALLAAMARAKHVRRDPFTPLWIALAMVFAGLSVDEFASVHELLDRVLRGERSTHGIFYFAWVIPAIVGLLVLGLFYRRLLLSLPGHTRRLFVLAAAIYVGGALGVAMLGGFVADAYGEENLTYALIAAAEEALEMAGVVVFIRALLLYLAAEVGPLEIRWGAKGAGRLAGC